MNKPMSKETEKLIKQAHFVAMAKYLLRQGVISCAEFHRLMSTIKGGGTPVTS